MKIICSGNLIRYPLGGFSFHHLQYLVGFARLGHQVIYVEDYGWEDSCYDAARGEMTSDPSYGIEYLIQLLRPHGLEQSWCYLSADGSAHGMTRAQLAQHCRESDVYFNLSNINWIPEFELCARRVLVDTDPVFTQIGGHGMSASFALYDALFTYGENIHRPGCTMPTADMNWQPTRQPVVLDLWQPSAGNASAPLTTVMNWTAYGERTHEGRVYGQKDREFTPFFTLPQQTGWPMEVALNAPEAVRQELAQGGWRIADPGAVTRTPQTYQAYLRASRAEFSVAKHAYVSTHCGWFSDRTTGYLALGRPAVVQDTGFSDFLPVGQGLLTFSTPDEAIAALRKLDEDYAAHCRAARAVIAECFDARGVLTELLERSLSTQPRDEMSSLPNAKLSNLSEDQNEKMTQPYTEQFFAGNSEWARSAAREIVPLVVDMIQPRSLIDVGCGAGTWLAAFAEHGVADIQGVDGAYVQRELLEIPAERFMPFDLTQPLHLERQFDLVVSLEVAEHLPPESAETFVGSLTRLGPVVLFSAAIPGQGGVQHINEQWPDYWAKLFYAAGYEPIDWLRKRIWQNEQIEWYYAQNMLTFARPEYIAAHPRLQREWEQTAPAQLSLVHPLQYQETHAWVDRICQTTIELAALIPATEQFILVDEAQLEGLLTAGRRYTPFPEMEGDYGGPPDDDDTAIAELQRLQQAGASFIVFAWPALWWLEHYAGLHRHLRTAARCVLENERAVIFDLRT